MTHLFSTWRMAYIEAPKHDGCIFCDFPKERRDAERLIVHRGDACFVIMNLYPYNPGHMMVVPYRHTCEFESLSPEEAGEMWALAARAVRTLKELMHPDGLNLGMNLGKSAGAGIDQHLHLHVVPRWNGDTNFMPVLADTRSIPQAVEETYEKIVSAWAHTEG